MFPKIDPKQMEKMLKQLGMKTEQIDAKEVVIKTADKELVISNPQVQKIEMGGQQTFQITGELTEKKASWSKEDIKLVAKEANVSEKIAAKALEEEGDIAQAILKLKKV